MITKLFQNTWKILRQSVANLTANDPLRMAGATAFFTSFALPAILMIIVRILGIFLDRRTLGRQLIQQFNELLGKDSTESIVQAIRGFRGLQHNYLITTCIFLFLIFVATTLFKVIKGSVNQIWKVRPRRQGNILFGLKSRIISLVVILLGGILFLTLQMIDAGQHMLSQYLNDAIPKTLLSLGAVWNTAIIVSLSALWFFVLFMLLPDARPDRKVAIWGALLTSILFNTGKWVLQILLKPGNVNSFYGASGAIVLVLLFVFYSSIILYFGAAFVKALGDFLEKPLRLKSNSMKYRLEEVEVKS